MSRILVIDDETNIRLTIRLALQHVGHEVDTAADGAEGLTKFAAGAGYDLVLLDQRMPGMEGLEVLKEIKHRQPEAKVVMITAFGTIDLAVEAMKAGATDFLRKPFTMESLRDSVQSILHESSQDQFSEVNSPVTYGMTTINGYRILCHPNDGKHQADKFIHEFLVRNPAGESVTCKVLLPDYIMQLVLALSDREKMPGNDRFWQALSEEALANYLWQNATFPPDSLLTVTELTTNLRKWVEAVLTAIHDKEDGNIQ